MAQYVLQFSATIPAGTPKTAPVTIALPLDNWDIEQIDLEVPTGPAGLMGFYVANNGVQWIPATPGAFLVWDGVNQSWPFTDQPNASGWAIVGYNTGVYQHNVTIRFHVNPTSAAAPAAAAPTITFVSSDTPASDPVTL